MYRKMYWPVGDDWRVWERVSNLLVESGGLKLVNDREVFLACSTLKRQRPVGFYGNPRFPSDFIRPELRMPSSGFAPDYFRVGRVTFASRRLRAALSQSPAAVQYHPVSITGGGEEARSQDYLWMNIIACHKAIDLTRSLYEMGGGTVSTTGEKFQYIQSYERMVFRDDIPPGAELFRVAEDLVTVLASDALAERVMRTGCTGIAFEAPETHRSLGPIHRYRTATGVMVEDMNQVYPPTP